MLIAQMAAEPPAPAPGRPAASPAPRSEEHPAFPQPGAAPQSDLRNETLPLPPPAGAPTPRAEPRGARPRAEPPPPDPRLLPAPVAPMQAALPPATLWVAAAAVFAALVLLAALVG